jgi:hypothetical protein
VTNLPMDGSTIYVRLYSWINIGWQYLDYTYTGLPIKSAMISPLPGSTTTGGTATFTWTAGQGVSRYLIYVGTIPGGNNLFALNTFTSTSATVNNLPKDGRTIYVRLYSWINIGWQYTDYIYVAGP